jgi:hypothetical protein
VLLMRQLVEMVAAHHQEVTVRVLPGNHDEHSAIAVAIALSAFFDGQSPRVTVDTDPSPYAFFRFGDNLIGAHHGHLSKPDRWPGIMASHCAADWGQSTYRHMLGGHFHHQKTGGEEGGMTWEIIPSPAARDAYHAGHGYWAGRSLQSRVYHLSDGPSDRHQSNIRPSLRRANNLVRAA